MRNFDTEFQDNEARKYAYDFDWRIRASLMTRIKPFITQTMSVLEVGCFRGDMTDLILKEFKSIDVLEASAELALEVQNRFGDRVLVHNSQLETFQSERKFDLIFLVHTLEHLNDRVAGLQKLKGLLSENGLLFVAVPNAYALSRQIAVAMGIIEHEESVTEGELLHGHQVTYSLESLTLDCELAGLIVVQSGGTIVKPLSNSQFDQALTSGVISEQYIAACDDLSIRFPELSASIYMICRSAH